MPYLPGDSLLFVAGAMAGSGYLNLESLLISLFAVASIVVGVFRTVRTCTVDDTTKKRNERIKTTFLKYDYSFCNREKIRSKSFFHCSSITSGMDQPSRCIRYLCTNTILNNVTGRKVNNYIRKHCCEYYLMPPGFEFRGITIQLKSPMLIGLQLESSTILLPLTKPCYGTMLYEIKAEDDDFSYIRSALGCKIRKGEKRES